MKQQNKKCYECGKRQLVTISEDVIFEGEGIETHTVKNLPHEKCLNCGERFFGPESQKIIDESRAALKEKIFNGRITLRIPKSLHAKLYQNSKEEGVSLNQLCLYFLSEGLGSQTIK